MGILKGIIDRFRAMGKSEKEISSIIETAADKATANPDVTKPEKPKKPEIKIETTAEAFVEAVLRTGTTLQQAKNGNFENEQFERCEKSQKHE
jgi:phage regulator Rha-like protein